MPRHNPMSSLNGNRKNIPKRRIYPAILRRVITQWLAPRWDRKNIPKRPIFPTILRAVITHESYIQLVIMYMLAFNCIVVCQYWGFSAAHSRRSIRCVCVLPCIRPRLYVALRAGPTVSLACSVSLATNSKIIETRFSVSLSLSTHTSSQIAVFYTCWLACHSTDLTSI